MNTLPIVEFIAMQKKGLLAPGSVIIDVRMDMEFAGGHMEGAINLDVSHPNFVKEISKYDKAKKYYLYCASGVRSRAACNMMESLGFKNVTNLDGGMMSIE